MKTLDAWLLEYAGSHRHPVNRILHKICVPLIFWSLTGFFTLPRADGNVWLSGAAVVALPLLAFYLRLGALAFFQMLLLILGCIGWCGLLERAVASAWPVYAVVFALAWI